MEIIAEVGVDVVQQRIRQLTRRLIDGVKARGYALRCPEEDERRGGIVMIQATAPEETVKRLVAQGFIVDYRPGLVRASPHFYNTPQEVDRFLDALDAVQRTITAA
jgi:kynureninase